MTRYTNLNLLWKSLLNDKFYLEAFCAVYRKRLQDIAFTREREPSPPEELMYMFDDGLGGYTIDGIINSLEEEPDEEERAD